MTNPHAEQLAEALILLREHAQALGCNRCGPKWTALGLSVERLASALADAVGAGPDGVPPPPPPPPAKRPRGRPKKTARRGVG
jgi:hypothetical protein